MNKEQFDKIKQHLTIALELFATNAVPSAYTQIQIASDKLNSAFPEFNQPEFRKVGLCTQTFEDDFSDGQVETHKIIDTSPHSILDFDEPEKGFYIYNVKGNDVFGHVYFRNGECHQLNQAEKDKINRWRHENDRNI